MAHRTDIINYLLLVVLVTNIWLAPTELHNAYRMKRPVGRSLPVFTTKLRHIENKQETWTPNDLLPD